MICSICGDRKETIQFQKSYFCLSCWLTFAKQLWELAAGKLK